MTNFEKYMNTIVSICNQDSTNVAVAMNIRTEVLGRCSEVGCECCKFSSRFSGNGRCEVNLVRWLFSEYQEPAPKLTKKERAFCEIVKDGYIARDKNRGLAYHSNLPEYYDSSEYWVPDFGIVKISQQYFNFITCEPGKAWSIKDLLKLEVCDD